MFSDDSCVSTNKIKDKSLCLPAPPNDSEHKLHEKETAQKNTYLTSFEFLCIMLTLVNEPPITNNSINLQYNEDQPLLT